MNRLLLGTALITLLAAPALADVVTLTDGSKREGKVVRESDKEVVLQVTQGRLSAEITFKREEVKAIEKGPTAAEVALAEVERRKAALKSGDAAGWLEYAQWLERQPGFGRDAREAWEQVVKLDPENATARARLGYQKVDGKWLTEAEAMAAKGLVLHEGRWVKPEEKPAAAAPAAKAPENQVEDIKVALAEEIRKQRAEEQAASATKRLAEWQTEMLARAAVAAAQQPPQTTVIRSGGVAMGPYGYGYYGVTTSDGQYLPFVPANGQGVVYYSDGTWLGGCGPAYQTRTTTTTTTSGGVRIQYRDSHWNIRLGGW